MNGAGRGRKLGSLVFDRFVVARRPCPPVAAPLTLSPVPPMSVRSSLRFGCAVVVAASLCGCDGFGGAAVVADADGAPAPGVASPVTPVQPASAQTAPARVAPEGPAAAPPAVERIEPRESRPRREETPRREPSPRRDDLAPAREQADGTTTVMTDAGPDPFDPEIDPATLAPPEPVAAPQEAAPPELKDFPLTAAVPPDRQAIPADLALPVGATLYYRDGRDWVEVELKTPAEPLPAAGSSGEPDEEAAANAPPLRVHRTDRPAVIPDVRIPRDQLVIPKLVVRRLRSARD